MKERLQRPVALGLIMAGLLGVAVGGGVSLQAWQGSLEHTRSTGAGSLASKSEARIIEVPPAEDLASARAASPPLTDGSRGGNRALPDETPADDWSMPIIGSRLARAQATDIELLGAEFRFLDAPEPGARARVRVELRSNASVESEPVGLAIAARWFESYKIIGAVPAVLDDRTMDDGARRFEFPGMSPGQTATLDLVLSAVEDDVEPPEIRIFLGGEAEVGRSSPDTVAPRPRPGPARAISIPRLGIQSSVVQTDWEPPPFVVGQIKGSANVSEGNSVLIGHLGGPQGNVFASLDRAKPGDEVVAVSRGVEYRFIVSSTVVLPNGDSGPTFETSAPRLTLMTCVGRWNPLTNDYSHRLWVVAEPPELARKTIVANAERAAAEAAATAGAAGASSLSGGGLPAAASGAADSQTASSEGERAGRAVAAAASATSNDRSSPGGGQAEPASVGQASSGGPPAAGLVIREPAPDAAVTSRFEVKGTRATPVDRALHVWLFVRAELEGSRWYPYPKEIEATADGSWSVTLDLGGPARLRHELRIGVVNDQTRAALLAQLAERPNEPLQDLPEGFWEEANLTVTRR